MQKQARTGKIIGYARVSTKDQRLRMQLDDLQKAGCWNIYQEHASASKRRKRPQLELALLDLRPGDTLVVWKLDRLARNLPELFQILERVSAAGAGFRSLTEQIDLDTAIGRLLLALFGGIAQFAAELTGERTARGIKALKDRGFMYGAQPKLSPRQAASLVRKRKAGATVASLAEEFEISTASVNNYLNRAKRRRKR